MNAAYAALWLVAGTALVASGLAKLLPERLENTRAALVRHGLSLRTDAVRAAAVAEILVGAGLLLTSGRLLLASAVAALAMLTGYTVLVVRILRSGEQGGCGCHGDRGGQVSWRTLARNGIALLLVSVVLLRAARGDHLPQLLHRLDGLSVAATVTVGVLPTLLLLGTLVHGARAAGRVEPVAPVVVEPLPAGPEDYVRWPVPDAPIHDGAGRRLSVRHLCRHGARLVLLVDAADVLVRERVYDWLATAAAWEPTVVAAVVTSGPDAVGVRLPAPTYRDRTGAAAVMLGARTLPSAVLLGADGYLAAGPAAGEDAVDELIAMVGVELMLELSPSP